VLSRTTASMRRTSSYSVLPTTPAMKRCTRRIPAGAWPRRGWKNGPVELITASLRAPTASMAATMFATPTE
jgi:hypothetical protein